jgi:Tol biopolymer transport system component
VGDLEAPAGELGKSTLYTVNSDGQALKAIRFGKNDINVSAFAWSPSGQRFAFRSDSDAKKLCNFSVVFYAQTGRQPCRDAENLVVANVDGSELNRISKDPEYRHGQLFWIQERSSSGKDLETACLLSVRNGPFLELTPPTASPPRSKDG